MAGQAEVPEVLELFEPLFADVSEEPEPDEEESEDFDPESDEDDEPDDDSVELFPAGVLLDVVLRLSLR